MGREKKQQKLIEKWSGLQFYVPVTLNASQIMVFETCAPFNQRCARYDLKFNCTSSEYTHEI